MPPLQPLRLLLTAVAGWVHREQSATIEYLLEENRVLREQMGKRRLRLTDDQRRRLAAKGVALSVHDREEGQGGQEPPPDGPADRSDDPNGRDPLDILDGSLGLQAIYAAIEHAVARFGHGRWRVVSDLIDATIEVVVKVAMDQNRTPPDNWPRYAIAVCRNLVKKGPRRGPLDLRRTLDWPEVEMVAPEPDNTLPPPELDRAKLPMHLLTDAEATAFNAVLEFGNVARAAEDVSMTRRGLHVRWRRAMEEFRSAHE